MGFSQHRRRRLLGSPFLSVGNKAGGSWGSLGIVEFVVVRGAWGSLTCEGDVITGGTWGSPVVSIVDSVCRRHLGFSGTP